MNTENFKRKFIVIDGIDGCGKSTQINLLSDYLKNQNIDVLTTVDPGGTAIGNQISRLLKYDAQGTMSVNTEVMLFMASRAQLVTEVVKPKLESGFTVLCDRFISSTCAYQGSSGYPVDRIIEFGNMAIGNIWPNLTVILDIPVKDGLQRTGRKLHQRTKVNHEDANQSYLFKNVIVDRFDSRPLEYHSKVRSEFLRLPDYYPTPVKIVDGSTGGIESVHEKIKEVVIQAFGD